MADPEFIAALAIFRAMTSSQLEVIAAKQRARYAAIAERIEKHGYLPGVAVGDPLAAWSLAQEVEHHNAPFGKRQPQLWQTPFGKMGLSGFAP